MENHSLSTRKTQVVNQNGKVSNLVQVLPTFPTTKLLLSPSEVARLIGVSAQHVHNLINEGQLVPCANLKTMGGRKNMLRLTRAEVIRFLEERGAWEQP